MTLLDLEEGTREDPWPSTGHIGLPVLLPGGEVGHPLRFERSGEDDFHVGAGVPTLRLPFGDLRMVLTVRFISALGAEREPTGMAAQGLLAWAPGLGNGGV
jgi:hypothetical protein